MRCGTGMSHRKSPIGDKAGANIRTVAVIVMMMVRDQWSYQLMHHSRTLRLSSSKRIGQLDIHWSSYQSVRKVKDAKMENTLSIVFGCEQCRQCQVKEQEAQFEYNLELLEVIVKKPLGKAPPRIQLALLRLQRYQFNAGNKARKSIHIADILTRVIWSLVKKRESTGCWAWRTSVQSKLQTFPGQTPNLRAARKADKLFLTVVQLDHSGSPERSSRVPYPGKAYWGFREEIHETSGTLLKGRKSEPQRVSERISTTDDTQKLTRIGKEQTDSWWYIVLAKHDNRN